MTLLVKFLASYHKSGLRGSYRLTDFLAQRLKSLQCISIKTESGTLFADLRVASSRGLSADPKIYSGEDIVMQHFVSEGDVVFDIGAHLGLFTLFLSKLTGEKGKVFAFEPNPKLLPSLTKTINQLTNVKLFPFALSDRRGEIILFVPEDPTMASLSNWTNGIAGSVYEVACEMQTLDDLLNEEKVSVPQFIKCDVEGAELSVFNGAKVMLNRTNAPVVMFEINKKAANSFGRDTTYYFDFIESLDKPKYKFYEIFTKGIEELRSKEIEYANIVAVPEAQIDLCREILL